MWLEDQGCKDIVELAWGKAFPYRPIDQVEGKIKSFQTKLNCWSWVAFGNITRALKEKKDQLRRVEELAIQGGSMDRVRRLKLEINRLLIKEEKMWKQRSRALWLHKGNQNTKYFHRHASHRFRRNQIEELENSIVVLCLDEAKISSILVTYYQTLFTSASSLNLDEVLAAMLEMITNELNALKQMEPLKALGPDGLPPLFF